MPVPVLERIRDEMLCLPGVGASILEISHRSPKFIEIAQDAERRLRQLLSISDDYAVLFMQGGSRLQFASIPMNLAGEHGPASYVVTGAWGKMASEEAAKFSDVSIACDVGKPYDRLPKAGEVKVPAGAAYVHFTSNETIQGVQFATDPDFGPAPMVCDASSDFLHRPVDVSKYGMIYACAQKNAGPAGVTAVILRKDLLSRSSDAMPTYFNYAQQAENDSMLNTPPTFAIYVLGLVAQWLQEEVGGLEAMLKLNREKAALLYDVLDEMPDFYQGHAQKDCRSLMNVTFRLPDEAKEKAFLALAKERDLTDLKGHRSVGGIAL